VGEPKVDGAAGRTIGQGGTSHPGATSFTLEDGGGWLRVLSLLPRERDVVVRGGPGFEFWTPGDERGGAWGSGQNWPLDPPEGGPLPADPYLNKMWLTFWGEDLKRLSPSNRKAVVPGNWRVEVSPQAPAREDLFLHALAIGDRGAPDKRVEKVDGYGLAGAVIEGDGAVLFATERTPSEAEVTIPDIASRFLVVAGLEPNVPYAAQLTSSFAPGAPVWRQVESANEQGVVYVPWTQKAGRLRLVRQGKEPR
jgi:hypothetical protein